MLLVRTWTQHSPHTHTPHEDTPRYCVWYLVSKGRLDLVIDEPVVDEHEEEPEV